MELKIKQPAASVRVRAPEWVKSNNSEVSCKVNGAHRSSQWEGRYVNLGEGKPGDLVLLTFPIHTHTVKEPIGNVPYTLTIKGSTVTSIDPPGKVGPLYNRPFYHAGKAPMRKMQRFVSEESIGW